MATTGLQSSGKVLHSKGRALALASAKAHHQSPTLFRNAEALLPSAEAEGSHQSRGARRLTPYRAAVFRSSGRINFEFHFDIDLNRDGLAL
jgi:hypothetical protein